MNRTYKILLCDVSSVAYSEFSHASASCESQNFYCGCDSYGSHIMLASFFQRHEAAIKEIVDTSFTLQCYCKNLCSWEVCDFCQKLQYRLNYRCWKLFKSENKFVEIFNPLDTGHKLNVHKAFRRCPGRLLNVLCAFNLRPVSRGTSAFL